MVQMTISKGVREGEKPSMGCREGFWEMVEPELGPKRGKKKKRKKGEGKRYFSLKKKQNWERNKSLQ